MCDPRPQLPEGYRRNSTRVGATLGATRTGLSVYELPPGQAISPYHYEEPEEEWLLVVSGTPTLRHPGGEEQLEPWDSSSSPPALPERTSCGTTASPLPALRCSPRRGATVGAVVYPDSDMVWMWTADDAVDLIVERGSALDDQRLGLLERTRPTPRRSSRLRDRTLARAELSRRCSDTESARATGRTRNAAADHVVDVRARVVELEIIELDGVDLLVFVRH